MQCATSLRLSSVASRLTPRSTCANQLPTMGATRKSFACNPRFLSCESPRITTFPPSALEPTLMHSSSLMLVSCLIAPEIKRSSTIDGCEVFRRWLMATEMLCFTCLGQWLLASVCMRRGPGLEGGWGGHSKRSGSQGSSSSCCRSTLRRQLPHQRRDLVCDLTGEISNRSDALR
jgi:hypothetical protein